MLKLPGIGPRDAVRLFGKLGFQIVRLRGHIVMAKSEICLVIPRHNPINALAMGSIAKQAGLTPEEFQRLC